MSKPLASMEKAASSADLAPALHRMSMASFTAAASQSVYIFEDRLYSPDEKRGYIFFILHAPDDLNSTFCITGPTGSHYFSSTRLSTDNLLNSVLIRELLNAWVQIEQHDTLENAYNVSVDSVFRLTKVLRGGEFESSFLQSTIQDLAQLNLLEIPCIRVGVLVDPLLDQSKRDLVPELLGSQRLVSEAAKPERKNTDPAIFNTLLKATTEHGILVRRLTDAIEKERKFIDQLCYIVKLKEFILSKKKRCHEKDLRQIISICDAAQNLWRYHSKHFTTISAMQPTLENAVECASIVFQVFFNLLQSARLKWEDWFMNEYTHTFRSVRVSSSSLNKVIQEWEQMEDNHQANANDLISSVFQALTKYDLVMKNLLESIGRDEPQALEMQHTYARVHDLLDGINRDTAHHQDYARFALNLKNIVLHNKDEVSSFGNYIICGIEGYRSASRMRQTIMPWVKKPDQLTFAEKPITLILMTRFILAVEGHIMQAEKKDAVGDTVLWPAKALMMRIRKSEQENIKYPVKHTIPLTQKTVCTSLGEYKGLQFVWRQATLESSTSADPNYEVTAFRIVDTGNAVATFISKFYQAQAIQMLPHSHQAAKFDVLASIRSVQYREIIFHSLAPLQGGSKISHSLLESLSEQEFDHIIILAKPGQGNGLREKLLDYPRSPGTVGFADLHSNPDAVFANFTYLPTPTITIEEPNNTSWSSFVETIGPFYLKIHDHILERRQHRLQRILGGHIGVYLSRRLKSVPSTFSPGRAETIASKSSAGHSPTITGFATALKRSVSALAPTAKKQHRDKPPRPMLAQSTHPELQLFEVLFAWKEQIQEGKASQPALHSGNVDELVSLLKKNQLKMTGSFYKKLGEYTYPTLYRALAKRLESFKPLIKEHKVQQLREMWERSEDYQREYDAFRREMLDLMYSPFQLHEHILSYIIDFCKRCTTTFVLSSEKPEFYALVFGSTEKSSGAFELDVNLHGEIFSYMVRNGLTYQARQENEQIASQVTNATFSLEPDNASIMSYDRTRDSIMAVDDDTYRELQYRYAASELQKQSLHEENIRLKEEITQLNGTVAELRSGLIKHETAKSFGSPTKRNSYVSLTRGNSHSLIGTSNE